MGWGYRIERGLNRRRCGTDQTSGTDDPYGRIGPGRRALQAPGERSEHAMTVNNGNLSHAVEQIPSGLFVITAAFEGQRSGVLARWVQQCSVEPPMIMVALPKGQPVEPTHPRQPHLRAVPGKQRRPRPAPQVRHRAGALPKIRSSRCPRAPRRVARRSSITP